MPLRSAQGADMMLVCAPLSTKAFSACPFTCARMRGGPLDMELRSKLVPHSSMQGRHHQQQPRLQLRLQGGQAP